MICQEIRLFFRTKIIHESVSDSEIIGKSVAQTAVYQEKYIFYFPVKKTDQIMPFIETTQFIRKQ